MSDLILHQYELSPFSEKMRKVLGVKRLAYHSVDQPNIAPKPSLTPLTGGYRRIPVLQIGAHVYCDTALMVRELDRRFPEPCVSPPAFLGAAEIVADHRLLQVHRLFERRGPGGAGSDPFSHSWLLSPSPLLLLLPPPLVLAVP